MTIPGLGQVHNGELLKGLCFFSIYLMLVLIGPRFAVRLPDRLLMPATGVALVLVIAFYLWTIFEAGRAKIVTVEPKKYNRWYFYLAFWLVGMVGVNGAVIDHIRSSTLQAFKIAGTSMEPAVRRGDFVLVDKTVYNRMAPGVGDVVVLVDPDDRSMVLIRKIAALPGQRLSEATSGVETVPHGMVYVSGERPGANGSSTFGFVSLRDLVGKARQIYWSSGPDGIRWNRIGVTLSARVPQVEKGR
jgi:signal peptidase I